MRKPDDYDFKGFREAVSKAIEAFDEEMVYLVKEFFRVKEVVRCSNKECGRVMLTARQWENLGSFRRDMPSVVKHAAKGLCHSCYTSIYRRGRNRIYVKGKKS